MWIYQFLCVLLSDFAFCVLSLVVFSYKFVIIIFLGSMFFHHRRDRQAFLFLLVSYPVFEGKAFQRSQPYVRSQFHLWALWAQHLEIYLLTDFKAIDIYSVSACCCHSFFFSGARGTLLSFFWVQICIQKILFYPALPAIGSEGIFRFIYFLFNCCNWKFLLFSILLCIPFVSLCWHIPIHISF